MGRCSKTVCSVAVKMSQKTLWWLVSKLTKMYVSSLCERGVINAHTFCKRGAARVKSLLIHRLSKRNGGFESEILCVFTWNVLAPSVVGTAPAKHLLFIILKSLVKTPPLCVHMQVGRTTVKQQGSVGKASSRRYVWELRMNFCLLCSACISESCQGIFR